MAYGDFHVVLGLLVDATKEELEGNPGEVLERILDEHNIHVNERDKKRLVEALREISVLKKENRLNSPKH
jgi:hypothetical protein